MQSETIGKLAEALAKAQGSMDNAIKDSANPFFKSKYADLGSVIDAIKIPLSSNGISYTHSIDENNVMTTSLLHSSGEWISSKMKLILNKQDMQALGSAISYARRYCLSALVGLTQVDDDGNAASNKEGKPENKEIKTVVVPFVMTEIQYQKIRELREQLQISQQQVSDHCRAITGKDVKDLNLEEYNTFIAALRAWGNKS